MLSPFWFLGPRRVPTSPLLFEALIIDWLKEASTQAVSRQLKLSWNAIDGIMKRAVKRGLARREAVSPTKIGVDETAFKKRHDLRHHRFGPGDGNRAARG